MKFSPTKPSSPIPISRSRAGTLDRGVNNHPPSRTAPGIYPLQSHVDTVPLAPDPTESTEPPDSSTLANTKDPLHTVDSLHLQVIRDKDGNTLGLRVVDINSTYGKNANVSAPFPVGKINTGLVFSVETKEGMEAAYTRALYNTGSKRIMGIMFAPPNGEVDGVARDADWSFLDPIEVEREDKEDEMKPAQHPGISRAPLELDYEDFKNLRLRD
ncbi:hypothetical protein F53441_642 [Fusarium austroafricanum]|uniref:Uncharacterized protein n=1 Tax=Fusarium austroafricanum TaxID=2364996 RepID=A0A8H4P359_9HYPO|nr:hypothetical protein F53441_642 [Fusarium austroafricanum]